MVKDETELRRELSPAEKKRQEKFDAMVAEYTNQGYRRRDLTVGIVRANAFALISSVPVLALGFILFIWFNPDVVPDFSAGRWGYLLAGFVLLTVLHELVHGLAWNFFTPRRFKDIEFGIMKQYLTPYCACTAPLSKGTYITGALAPLFAVGVLPYVIAVICGSPMLMLLGLMMILGAGGDVLIVKNILTYKTDAKEVLYIDHPTQAGGVILER